MKPWGIWSNPFTYSAYSRLWLPMDLQSWDYRGLGPSFLAQLFFMASMFVFLPPVNESPPARNPEIEMSAYRQAHDLAPDPFEDANMQPAPPALPLSRQSVGSNPQYNITPPDVNFLVISIGLWGDIFLLLFPLFSCQKCGIIYSP